MFVIASIVFMVCLTGDKDLPTMVYSGLAILLSSVILLLVELHTYSNNTKGFYHEYINLISFHLLNIWSSVPRDTRVILLNGRLCKCDS